MYPSPAGKTDLDVLGKLDDVRRKVSLRLRRKYIVFTADLLGMSKPSRARIFDKLIEIIKKRAKVDSGATGYVPYNDQQDRSMSQREGAASSSLN